MNYNIIEKFIILLTCGLASAVNNSSDCDKNPITDIRNRSISYDNVCGGETPCIYKCCLENEVIYRHKMSRTCKHIDEVKKVLNDDLSTNVTFANIKVYDSDIHRQVKVLETHRNFNVIHSSVFMEQVCSPSGISTPLLLENGNAVVYVKHKQDPWRPLKSGLFCVDVAVGRRANKTVFHYFYKILNQKDNGDATKKHVFIAISMTISSLFLLVVLAVYSLLHQLRNIQGLLLMAYVATLMASYSLRAAYLFYIYYKNRRDEPPADTSFISQVYYFSCLSSFFWLKIMSFDIWWTFRGLRKLREIHRRGIHVKFMIYALYAYGAPAAMTIAAAIVDGQEDLPDYVSKPNFSNFNQGDIFFYLYVPIMILTGINCLLFFMTVYNIWLIHRTMRNMNKGTTKKNLKDQNRFWLYIKLSSLMGVGWIIEVAQTAVPQHQIPVWLFMLINTYTMLTGVFIFFMFVFKRSILVLLCQRFQIENRLTRSLNINSSTRSDFTKTSRKYSRAKSTTDSEIDGGSEQDTKAHYKDLNICPGADETQPLKPPTFKAIELEDQNSKPTGTRVELH